MCSFMWGVLVLYFVNDCRLELLNFVGYGFCGF